MSAFNKAWALLKGQYMHPSVMGHFARARMAFEDADWRDLLTGQAKPDDDPSRYGVGKEGFYDDDTIDPAPYDPRKRTGPTAMPKAGSGKRNWRYDELRRIARNTGFGSTRDSPLHRHEEKVRPKIREKALSYPQQAVDDFVARLYNPPTIGPFFRNPTEKELNSPYKEFGLKELEPGDKASMSNLERLANAGDRYRLDDLQSAKRHPVSNYTDAEKEAYLRNRIEYGLNDPIRRTDNQYYEPDKYEYAPVRENMQMMTREPYEGASYPGQYKYDSHPYLEQTTFKQSQNTNLLPLDYESRQV